MRHPGIERHKKLKDEMAAFPILVKIHRGDYAKKRNVRKNTRKKNNIFVKNAWILCV